MARRANTKKEIRILFSRTGNQCAFPDCVHPLIDDDDDFVAQICHIEAAEEGGPRYNPNMTDEDRKSVKNLIVLCYRHHKKTDNAELYTVSHLRRMKEDHEKNWSERPYGISNRATDRIFEEQIEFEYEVSRINEIWRQEFDLAMELELSEDPSIHLNEIADNISRMGSIICDVNEFLGNLSERIEDFLDGIGYDLTDYRKIPYYENPFVNAFWEIMNIGAPNFMSRIEFHSKALEFHIEIEKIKARPNDALIRAKLDKIKSEILRLASTSAHVD